MTLLEGKGFSSIFKGAQIVWMMIGALMILLLVVSFLKMQRLGSLERDIQEAQIRVVDDAFDAIEEDFEDLQTGLVREARALAEEAALISSLERYTYSDDPASLEWLIRRFIDYRLPDRGAVELYTAAPRLVAWKGYSLPLGTTPESPGFPDSVKIEVINDANVRQALVVWHPVVHEGRAIGAVRTMRLLSVRMPVENQFLQSYTLSDTWRLMVGVPVRVRLGKEAAFESVETHEGHARQLNDLYGDRIGSVYIPFPPREELTDVVEGQFDGWLAFFLTCILLLFIGWFRGQTHPQLDEQRTVPLYRQALYLGVLTAGWWGTRFILLALDVPGRWQRGKAPLSPLFDPNHFASDFGWGLTRSMGDMFTSALFLIVFSVWTFRFATGITRQFKDRTTFVKPGWAVAILMVIAVAGAIATLGLTHILASVVDHAVLDSTLDYFARTGFLPDRLVFFVFCCLLLITMSIMLLVISVLWIFAQLAHRNRPITWRAPYTWLTVFAISALGLWGSGQFLNITELPVLIVTSGFLFAGWALVVFAIERPRAVVEWMHFRAALLAILLLTLPLYMLLYRSMDTQLRLRMEEAASTFDTDRNLRVIYAIEQVLDRAGQDTDLKMLMGADSAGQRTQVRVDSVAEQLFRGSALASLGTYDVSITVFDTLDNTAGRYLESDENLEIDLVDAADRKEFDLLKSMYAESKSDSILVEKVTGRLESDRFQYEGLGPVYDNEDRVGWVMVRVEPKTILRDEGTLFPKVLLPAGVSQVRGDFALAEFQDRVLVRSLGADFGLYRLPDRLYESLLKRSELWQAERSGDKEHLTYYRRKFRDPFADGQFQVMPAASETINAVRAPLINLFDHLYYLLRMTVAGLVVGAPLYWIMRMSWLRRHRWRRDRSRFKDRILNAFLLVGLIAVGIVGVIGLRVVTAENDNAIQSWIKAQLERVEESLALDADFGELPSGVLDSTNVATLAEQVGLDLNVYRDNHLLRTSRQQLTRDRLIDSRLPIEAYYYLNYEGARHAFTNERVGEFEYMAGYRVLADRDGSPKYIISVPTLPEQERIEEERARTVAYLFGALLLLVVAIMLTASLLANALSRPIGRLRQGLEAVAQGRFERALPVETRDEIGELVQTFNEMQSQLADSRRKLAQQERQLAWREMARQVAHEIKNPLTPMKLSVQHLRRAFAGQKPANGASAEETDTRFKDLFERITSTLIEQVDALARIANEFSSFARLPKRILEPLDLNAVVQEAVDLMQEQVDAQVRVDLYPAPLVLEADREELRRIYINLIKNAFEATPEDRMSHVRVTTSIEAGNGSGAWAYTTVSDEGMGIKPEARTRIFEPNFSSKTSGTGLGLAIVKKGIEDLHGEIGFETEENVGTTFWIRIPLLED